LTPEDIRSQFCEDYCKVAEYNKEYNKRYDKDSNTTLIFASLAFTTVRLIFFEHWFGVGCDAVKE